MTETDRAKLEAVYAFLVHRDRMTQGNVENRPYLTGDRATDALQFRKAALAVQAVLRSESA